MVGAVARAAWVAARVVAKAAKAAVASVVVVLEAGMVEEPEAGGVAATGCPLEGHPDHP